MSELACSFAKGNSVELLGPNRPSIQQIVSNAFTSLEELCVVLEGKVSHFEAVNLCKKSSVFLLGNEHFLQSLLEKFIAILKKPFSVKGGHLTVYVYDVKRRSDRKLFPGMHDYSKLNGFVGLSLKTRIFPSNDLCSDEMEYDSLFGPTEGDSCFSSEVLDDLDSKGITFTAVRGDMLKSGVIFTLYLPKE